MKSQEILDAVNRGIRPMSIDEALEFVKELIDELEVIADALRHDKGPR